MSHKATAPSLGEENFETLVDEEYRLLERGYRSPLVARLTQTRLSVEMLSLEIPRIKKGEQAEELLETPGKKLSEEKIAQLQHSKKQGREAKEVLFTAALPLIRAVAHKEWRRRQQWGSQVSMEDLVQEATIGFLKGINAFKPEAIKKSATNYLGQWMLVEMRRSAEVMDHDLQVGHDAGERFRKIRALRSRLKSELGREPTDEEISNASRDPNYSTKPSMLGKAPTAGEGEEELPKSKGVTLKQVAEEWHARSRVGHAARFDQSLGDEDRSPASSYVVDPSRATVAAPSDGDAASVDPAQAVTDLEEERVIAIIVEKTLIRMRLPGEQKDIVARRYGLPPHDSETSAREIARLTGIHRERVTRILNAFAEEMTRKGGVFHEICSQIPLEDLSAVGLGWIYDRLGEWDPVQNPPHSLPRVLTEDRSQDKSVSKDTSGTTTQQGVQAWYYCDYGKHTFSSLYASRKTVPKSRACPQCGKKATLIEIVPKTK